jgi:hypothetical protein
MEELAALRDALCHFSYKEMIGPVPETPQPHLQLYLEPDVH